MSESVLEVWSSTDQMRIRAGNGLMSQRRPGRENPPARRARKEAKPPSWKSEEERLLLWKCGRPVSQGVCSKARPPDTVLCPSLVAVMVGLRRPRYSGNPTSRHQPEALGLAHLPPGPSRELSRQRLVHGHQGPISLHGSMRVTPGEQATRLWGEGMVAGPLSEPD